MFLADKTGANFISIRIGEGTLTYSTKREIQPRKSRGNLFQQREGEEQQTEISFQFVWDFITSSGTQEVPTVEDVLYNRLGWISANAAEDPQGPFCVNLQLVNAVPCYGPQGGAKIETLNFPLFTWTSLDHSLKDSTVDCKGVSNRVMPNVVRSS